MNVARQTTHSPQKQQTFGGSLPRRRAEDEPTLSGKSLDAFRFGTPIESVRGVPGPSPGLWDLASQSERRGFASSSSEYPRKAQRPGVAMPQQSKPLAPPSWGGQTTYKTAHKNKQVYRPGQGSGTPPIHPVRAIVRLLSAANRQRHLRSQHNVHGASTLNQSHNDRTSSGLCRSECFGSSITIDGIYLVPSFHHESLQIHLVEVVCINALDREIVATSTSTRLETGVSRSHAGMEEERCRAWSRQIVRSGAAGVGCLSGADQLALVIFIMQSERGVFLKTLLEVFFSRESAVSPRLATLFSIHFKPLSFRVELKRSVRDCYGIVWQLSIRITCREVCSSRLMQTNPATREPGV